MNIKPIHNPVLILLRDNISRKMCKEDPKRKKYIQLLTKKERKKLQAEVDDCEPYGA